MMAASDSCFASIIVPVYNAERWLRECINSILAQTDPDYELLLINDGSRDQSGAILDSYANEGSHSIRVIHQANQGVAKARNVGIEIARGKFLLFVDADDIVHPQLIETLKAADHTMHSDCYHWGYQEFTESLKFTPVQETAFTFCSKDDLLAGAFKQSGEVLGYVWNKAFKRTCVQQIRFDEDIRLQEDLLYVCRSLVSNTVQTCCRLNIPLYGYRQTAQSATHLTFTESQLTTLYARERMIRLLENGSDSERNIAAFLLESLPHYVCVMNKKLLHTKLERRTEAFQIIDRYWDVYAKYAMPSTWSNKDKIYFLLQRICFPLRRKMQ